MLYLLNYLRGSLDCMLAPASDCMAALFVAWQQCDIESHPAAARAHPFPMR
jgi:hypothetical protein